MSKRTNLIRFFKFVALIIPIALMICFLQSYLFYHADYTTERIRDFYKETPNSLDVVILGASDIYNGYSPVQAYEYGGFTSYPYAWGSIPGQLYVPALKEILAHQDPQLILIEIEGFVKDNISYFIDESKLRTFTENIPMSLNSLRAIRDFELDDRLSCVIPFFKYHGDWSLPSDKLAERLWERTQSNQRSLLKGVTCFTLMHTEWPKYDVMGDSTTRDLLPEAEESLYALLDFCREEQLDNIVFLRYPHKIINEKRYDRFTRANRVGEIIEENGFPFLDLEQRFDDIMLDYETDFYDSEHLNVYGQQKMTEYLSAFIMDECGIVPMEQTPENQAHWDSCIPYSTAYYEIGMEYADRMEARRICESPGHFIEELEERIASWEE